MKLYLKTALILAIAPVLVSCDKRQYLMLTEQVGNYGIQRFEDKEKNVFCYVYRDSDGNSMTCLKGVK
jgi:hypothetical protein